jgi:hypothetical protein
MALLADSRVGKIQGAMCSHPQTSYRKRARCVLDATMVARGAGNRACRAKDDLRRDGGSVRRAVSLGLTLRYAISRALTLVSGPMNATLAIFCSLGPSFSCPYSPKLVQLDFRWDEKADPLRSTLRSLQMFSGLSL